ncbi:MAG TPA: NFACT family protein, partial [Clostridia bacterium]|nr:NFACT family protein [Clostridia bacterium]
MSCDLFVLNALASELNAHMSGGKIDKITQPEMDEVRFHIRKNGQNLCLVASCNAQAPRLNLTESKKQNPVNAPAFCMLLRKHLLGARIDKISIFNQDRTICIDFSSRTEMQDEARYKIYVELMNRYSNIVFVDGNEIILDAVKRLPLDEQRDHAVFRGLVYEPIKQPKTCVFSAQIIDFENFTGGNLEDFIMSSFSGFSRSTTRELIAKTRQQSFDEIKSNDKLDITTYDTQTAITSPMTKMQAEKIVEQISHFENIASSSDFSPCTIDNNVYPFPYSTLVCENNLNLSVKNYATLSQAFDAQNSNIDTAVRLKAKTKHLVLAIKRMREHTEKRIIANREKLKECENMEQSRIFGELIITNIYKIKRGDKDVIVENYYSGKDTEIPLDEKLSPSQNSNAYYKKYNKLKRTEVFLEKKTAEDEVLLNYLASIEDSINQIELNDNLSDIENELASIGAIKKGNKERSEKRSKPQPPLKYKYDDFTILKGKNNIQNDNLTFKIASSRDTWLHLKDAHGAHCVIICEGRIPPYEVIKFAAEITASSLTESAQVDYTER